MKIRTKVSIAIPFLLLAVLLTANIAANANPATPGSQTATPIKHLVVIFQENISTDHYFGTYPVATNPPNEPQFNAAPDTPTIVGGYTGSGNPLITDNPNNVAAGISPSASNNYTPNRLDRTEPVTCDNNHDYSPEQAAYNGGLVNMFPENTGCSQVGTFDSSMAMNYYDGNTVTALWNYAQNFALNDYAFGTSFGPSSVGALNVVSGIGGPAAAYTTTAAPTNTSCLTEGTTAGSSESTTQLSCLPGVTASTNGDSVVNAQLTGDADPLYDDCSWSAPDTQTVGMSSGALNVGNLLNTAGVTWGWFQGGFTPTTPYNPTTGSPAVCAASQVNVGGTAETSYVQHHDPFQFFQSTANPHHLPPSSPSMIGHTDQANHNYDVSSFWVAADSGNLPAVSYLKAPKAQNGHPSNSDPLDEQTWLVNTINQLMSLPTWSSTAVVIDWDDSDGWYDAIMPPIVQPSNDPANDLLNGAGACGTVPTGGIADTPLGVADRCGYGPRIPLLVISPYAKSNYIDNTLATQTAIVSFIEYNWNLAATTPGLLGPESYDTMAGSIMNMFDFSHPQQNDGRVFLNPSTGEVVQSYQGGSGFGFGAADQGSGQQVVQNTPGVPDLSTTSTCTDADTNPDVCATQNNIGNAAISSTDTVWFSATADITPRESSSATTVHFSGQWINLQLQGGNGLPLSIPAPNSEVVFSSTATSATTTYSGGQWVTTVPVGYTGDVFIGGVAYQVPTGVSLAGAKADWEGTFSGTTVSFTLQWQWAGAVYSTLGTGFTTGFGKSTATTTFYNALGVNPTSASLTTNPAGTPENFVSDYLSSATVGTYHGDSGPDTGAYNQPGDAYYQAYLLNE